MKRILIITTLVVLLVSFGAYALRPQEVETTPQRDYLTTSEIIRLTNNYRATKDLPPLQENDLLNQSACLKAQDMVDKDYWSHNAPDGTEPSAFFIKAGYTYQRAGENLAYSQNTAQHVVINWIDSPTHEATLSGDYQDTGVCVMKDIKYQSLAGTTLIVAHYGTR